MIEAESPYADVARMLLSEHPARRPRIAPHAPASKADLSVIAEEPVSLGVFLRDSAYLKLPPLSDVQMNTVLHAERVYYPETLDALGWPKLRNVEEIVCQWGKGGGKDHIARIAASRVMYLLGCLKHPQVYYGMVATDTIDILNTAINAPQAQNRYFTPLARMLERSPWFRRRINLLRSSVELGDKGVIATSGHSEAESQEGGNLILAVMDEISGFKTRRELGVASGVRDKTSAEGLYDMARSSVRSRFPTTGKVVLLSFPRYRGDFIQQKCDAGKDDPSVLVSVASTWEANPMRRKEEFAGEYRKNPEAAAAKYECKPLASSDAYLKDFQKIRVAFSQPIEQSPTTADGSALRTGWVSSSYQPACVHVDLALTNDRAALAVAHQEPPGRLFVPQADGAPSHSAVDVDLPLVVVDLVMFWEAPPGGEIDIASIEQHLWEIVSKGIRLVAVTADQFQSASLIQAASKRRLRSELLSVDRTTAAYDMLKALAYAGRLRGPAIPLLLNELEALTLVDGRKVDHPPRGSKDLADAVAGAVYAAATFEEAQVARTSMVRPIAIGKGIGYNPVRDSGWRKYEDFRSTFS